VREKVVKAKPWCIVAAMTTITFDTFKFVDRLEKAGLTRDQAAAIVEAQKDAFSEALDTSLATKADIAGLGNRVQSLDAKIDAMELRMTIKLGAFLSVAVGVLIAVMRLPH
jgi:hypothetical protein